LLEHLLSQGDAALHASVQTVWPLDPEAAFGALPTPLRLHADPRFAGRGLTLALLDSGFYPHPDLISPSNRIRAWVDAGVESLEAREFGPTETPQWPGWDAGSDWQWHGLMTSVAAAGNGYLSHGLYRGLAPEAELVLVSVREPSGRITNQSIQRGLSWILEHGSRHGVRVVSLSCSGDLVSPLAGNPVDQAVSNLTESGVTVVAAAGNDGVRRLVPPATAPFALTVGGLDDHNTFDHAEVMLWHSNFGESDGGAIKPELVAPSIWVVAPVLPMTDAARQAGELFARRMAGDGAVDPAIAERKLVTPHYQHVDGTSFAAPLVASAVCCMLEANPDLAPLFIRDILRETATPVPGAPPERQGAGALEAGLAVTRALHERHGRVGAWPFSPRRSSDGVVFAVHEHDARQVEVLGSWNGWSRPGIEASEIEAGVWESRPSRLPSGRHEYKFLFDGTRWLDDPANPSKTHDGQGHLNSVLIV
jgi:serine protease AprX